MVVRADSAAKAAATVAGGMAAASAGGTAAEATAEASAEGREAVETAAAAPAAAAMVAERSTHADAECLRPSRPMCRGRLRPASLGGSRGRSMRHWAQSSAHQSWMCTCRRLASVQRSQASSSAKQQSSHQRKWSLSAAGRTWHSGSTTCTHPCPHQKASSRPSTLTAAAHGTRCRPKSPGSARAQSNACKRVHCCSRSSTRRLQGSTGTRPPTMR